MTFILENWVLILVAFASGGMLVWPLVNKGRAGGVSTSEAVRLISGHAAGARNVPFGALEGARELPGNKTLPLVVMCPSGARSGRAVGLLRKAGYANAVALSGGTAAWRDANLPIEKKG